MTASAGAWYRVGTVNVTKNNQTVTGVTTNWQNDVIAIAVGDIFTLDAKTWYEVTAVASDTSITLDRGFEGATGLGQSYAIVRNTSGTILTRIAGQVSVQFNQKQLFLDELRTWLNSTNASEELTDSHGLKRSLKTPAQMVADHDNRLAELDEIHPYPWAMRKVEFEANRAQNNEKFAASGFVHFGKHYAGGGFNEKPINEGLNTSELNPNTLRLGRGKIISKAGVSKSDLPILNISGVLSKLDGICYESTEQVTINVVKLPPAEDGTRTYDSSTGESVKHTTPAIAFASETATNKVVTDRVDMWGFEAYLREVNDDDPFVYAKGLIQSLATNISGVTTVSDNVRPITYFAWYEGDEDSRGKGVNWQTASETNRIKIASDPVNNIYFDDETGKFYQWCVRGRSFAGAGNGDWLIIDSTQNNTVIAYQGVGSGQTVPQGHKNIVDGTLPYYTNGDGTSNGDALGTNLGVVTPHRQDVGKRTYGILGQCYFLVCGTVNRLNRGAYHPSFNPSGAAKWGGGTLENPSRGYRYFWNESKTLPSLGLVATTRGETFTLSSTATQGLGNLGGEAARPDGRYFDAIYASGQGGVCRDMRYSAWGLTQEDFAMADLAVKFGEYRGREKPYKIRPLVADATITLVSTIIETSYTFAGGNRDCMIYNLDKNDYRFSLVAGQTAFLKAESVTPYENQSATDSLRVVANATGWEVGDALAIFEIEFLQTSIAGEYTHTEVFGHPANILLCDALKDGWVGSYSPSIPDGVAVVFQLTKPYTGSGNDITRTYTVNNGESWPVQLSSLIGDRGTNTVNYSNMPANQVTIYQYPTRTKISKSSVNNEVRNINNVLISDSATQARDLGFALTGNINSSASNQAVELSLNQIGIDLATGRLSASKETKHVAIPLAAPTNNSPAFKALNYNVVENQQGFINYVYTELKHNGTDWGDDGKIHIVDNQSTMLDTNGNTVKVGTARIVEPLGWIKNDK